MLHSFIDLNNKVLNRFTDEERKKIGVHSCPGGDHDSTHSADIAYVDLLPLLFQLNAGNFYLEFAGEKDKNAVLAAIRENLRPSQTIFLGVTDVLNPKIETSEDIRDTILHAAEFIPVVNLLLNHVSIDLLQAKDIISDMGYLSIEKKLAMWGQEEPSLLATNSQEYSQPLANFFATSVQRSCEIIAMYLSGKWKIFLFSALLFMFLFILTASAYARILKSIDSDAALFPVQFPRLVPLISIGFPSLPMISFP